MPNSRINYILFSDAEKTTLDNPTGSRRFARQKFVSARVHSTSPETRPFATVGKTILLDIDKRTAETEERKRFSSLSILPSGAGTAARVRKTTRQPPPKRNDRVHTDVSRTCLSTIVFATVTVGCSAILFVEDTPVQILFHRRLTHRGASHGEAKGKQKP